MDIQIEKKELIEKLKQVEDEGLLRAIKSMLDYGLNNQQDAISIEEYNAELETAEREIAAGKLVSHEEVMKMAEKW